MSEENVMDIVAAQRILDAHKQSRVTQASEHIQALLNEFKCELRATIIIGGDQAIQVPIQIIAL